MPNSRSQSPPPRNRKRERERSPRDSERGYRRYISKERGQHYKDRRSTRREDSPQESRGDSNRHRSSNHSPQRSRKGTKQYETPVEDEKRLVQRPKSKSPSQEVDKRKPNFNPSGLLAAATNTVVHEGGKSTVLKYNEPPEARKPTQSWRLYVFKNEGEPDTLHISRQSAYLIGRDKMVADITLDHPSCSKQHAALQYRSVASRDEFGSVKNYIKPFIIDLESTNGTHVNNEEIPAARYYELKSGDVIKFGLSTREYVILMDPDS